MVLLRRSRRYALFFLQLVPPAAGVSNTIERTLLREERRTATTGAVRVLSTRAGDTLSYSEEAEHQTATSSEHHDLAHASRTEQTLLREERRTTTDTTRVLSEATDTSSYNEHQAEYQTEDTSSEHHHDLALASSRRGDARCGRMEPINLAAEFPFADWICDRMITTGEFFQHKAPGSSQIIPGTPPSPQQRATMHEYIGCPASIPFGSGCADAVAVGVTLTGCEKITINCLLGF